MATLFGRYEYVGELGRGASGRVFAVRDRVSGGARRAVKVVPAPEQGRLIWEFARLCQVEHPGLARVRELLRLEESAPAPLGLASGTLLLVEDFVEGAPLSSALALTADDASSRLALVARAAVGVGEALAALHDAGLVHGDVKPDNVLCAESGGQVVLIDLGFAREPALTGAPRGTPAYMAPELFAGVCTPAADVYALGAMLVDLLVGHAALAVTSALGAVGSRSRELAGLPPEAAPLAAPLAQLLAPDPGDRPADGRAALSLLLASLVRLGLRPERAPLEAAGLAGLDASGALQRAARALTLPRVGHGPALASLMQALAEPGVVVVRGPPGAGRSRLVREAIRLLQERGASRGDVVPTWVASLDALAMLRDVDALLWLDGAEAEDDALRALAMAKLSVRSLRVVVELFEPGTEPPRLRALPGVRFVDVGALDTQAITLLLTRLLAPERPSEAVIRAAQQRSAGLSGRLCRLVEHGLRAGRDLRDARIWELLDAPRGAPRMTPRAHMLASALAWLGTTVTPHVAAALLGGADAADAAYRELMGQGQLSDDADGLRLAPVLAAGLRRETWPARRALVGQLRAAGLQPARAALGFAALLCEDEPGARARFAQEAQALRREGRSEAACALLREATAWLPDATLARALADAERACGRYDAALLALGGGEDDETRLARAELLRLSDRAEEACALLDSLVSDSSLRARALAHRARLSYDAGELARARAEAEQAEASKDREAQLRALEVEVLVALALGELAGAPVDLLVERAAQASESAPSPLARALARARALRAQVLLRRGERARAMADLRAALEGARALGEAHERATYALNLGLVELEGGELGRALETLREAAAQLVRMARPRDLARVLFNFALLAHLIGDLQRAEQVLDDAEAALAHTSDHAARALIAIVRADIALARGALESAESLLVSTRAALSEAPGALLSLLSARASTVAVARGDLARAEAHLARASEQSGSDDTGMQLELATAELRLSIARAEPLRAERCVQRGLPLLGDAAPFPERLRFLLAAIEAARVAEAPLREAERSALARSWLERALSTLPGDARARMRAVPAYARILAAPGYEPERGAGERAERWRALVRASRRLFAETHESRLIEALCELSLELVQAERALLITFDERSELTVAARAELSRDAERGEGFSRSVLERVALEGQPLMVVEAASDTRLDRAASVAALRVRSVLCVELLGLPQRAFLYLDDRLRPAAFVSDDLALVQDLAELARQALRVGEQLEREARRARRAEQQQRRLSRALARSQGEPRPSALPFIGDSQALARVLATARRVALSDAPVLIGGESGTGKELLARFIHDASLRKGRPFVAESCAAMPDTLLESALFGHVRGAFTGAERARKGLFELADGGTLFLDEVGEMSASLQSKLLRVLQEGELRPLGSERARAVDVRVLGATRSDLRALVEAGRFREDLYYRLAVVTLWLPALRERREDVAPLVAHFVEKHARGRKVRVSAAALAALEARPWPGNVRELENEVRRALALCDVEITPEHLSAGAQGGEARGAHAPGELDLHAQLEVLTRTLVERALARAGGNVTRAAALLGISRFGLQKILKRQRA